jgi:hypothetical protein
MAHFSSFPYTGSYSRNPPHSWSGVSAHGNSHVHNGNNTHNNSDFFYRASASASCRIDGRHGTNHVSSTYNITNVFVCSACLGVPGQQFRPMANHYSPARPFEPHMHPPPPPGLSYRQRPPQYPSWQRIPVPQTRQHQVWPDGHTQIPRDRFRPRPDDDGEGDDDSCKLLLLCLLLLRFAS